MADTISRPFLYDQMKAALKSHPQRYTIAFATDKKIDRPKPVDFWSDRGDPNTRHLAPKEFLERFSAKKALFRLFLAYILPFSTLFALIFTMKFSVLFP